MIARPFTHHFACTLGIIVLALTPSAARAQAATDSSRAAAQQARELRDGQRDFDFEIGTWKTHLRRLVRPLSGSTTWVEYQGTTVMRPVLDGKANLVELVADGPAGHFEGLSLRLYNSQARQWTLNFANARDGALVPPVIGEFVNGRGEFHGQDSLDGRAIFVRFTIIPLTRDSIRFEQFFSNDGGRTWELNWVATDSRVRQTRSDR